MIVFNILERLSKHIHGDNQFGSRIAFISISMRGPLHMKIKAESGSALLASVMLIVLLTGAGLAAMTTTSVNQQKTKNLRTEKQALYLAEAGLAHGKVVLNQTLANWNAYA